MKYEFVILFLFFSAQFEMISSLSCKQLRAKHIADCEERALLSNDGSNFCELCGKDLSHMNLTRRLLHQNKCALKSDQSKLLFSKKQFLLTTIRFLKFTNSFMISFSFKNLVEIFHPKVLIFVLFVKSIWVKKQWIKEFLMLKDVQVTNIEELMFWRKNNKKSDFYLLKMF